MKAFLVLACALTCLLGCATTPPPEPLRLQDISDMAKSDMSDHDIVQEIEKSRTVFYLSAEDVVRLREAGVSASVIDHMLETRVRRAVMAERRRRYYDRHFYPYYYGDYRYYYYPRRTPPIRTPHYPPGIKPGGK